MRKIRVTQGGCGIKTSTDAKGTLSKLPSMARLSATTLRQTGSSV